MTGSRLVWGAGLLVLALALAVPFAFSSHVPCQDDWVLLPIAEKALAGQSVFSDCWQRYNEHRHFFSRLLMVYGAVWTGWNPVVPALLNVLFVLSASWALARLAAKRLPDRAQAPSFMWSILIFTLCSRAAKTTVWLSMMSFYLAMSLAVLSLAGVSYHSDSKKHWLFGALLALASSWTLAGGLMVWPAALPVLAAVRRRPIFKFACIIWAGGTLLAAAPILSGISILSSSSFPSILEAIHSVLIFLGGIFFPLPLLPFGVLAAVLGAWAAAKGIRETANGNAASAGIFSVLLFVLFNALAASAVRHSYGPTYAANDRYVTIACWYWAALSIALIDASAFSRILSVAVPLLAAALLSVAPYHWQNSAQCRRILDETGARIRAGVLLREDAAQLYLEPDAVWKAIPILKARKWAMFRNEEGLG